MERGVDREFGNHIGGCFVEERGVSFLGTRVGNLGASPLNNGICGEVIGPVRGEVECRAIWRETYLQFVS
jgi:hypothetical protein